MTVAPRNKSISEVNEVDVLKAMLKFRRAFVSSNDYKGWLHNENYTYAVIYEDYPYPPKYLLELATGMKTTEFKGADRIRCVFNQMGFATQPLR